MGGQSLHLTGAEGTFSGVIAGEGLCRPGPDGTVRYPWRRSPCSMRTAACIR